MPNWKLLLGGIAAIIIGAILLGLVYNTPFAFEGVVGIGFIIGGVIVAGLGFAGYEPKRKGVSS